MPSGVPQQYQMPDVNSGNYSVGPAASNPSHGLNQQAASFTPRTANIASNQRANQRQTKAGNGNGSHPVTQDQDLDAIEDQMRRFNMNQRPQ